MPKYITTITRDSADHSWINNLTLDSITQDNIKSVDAAIFLAYKKYLVSLPGYVESDRYELDPLTFVVVHNFDTMENTISAQALLESTDPNSIVDINRRNLVDKRSNSPAILTITYSIVP